MVVAGVLNDDKCDDNKNTSYFHKVSVQLVERSPCEVITQSRKWGLGRVSYCGYCFGCCGCHEYDDVKNATYFLKVDTHLIDNNLCRMIMKEVGRLG